MGILPEGICGPGKQRMRKLIKWPEKLIFTE